jgi:hypothetical protein
MRRIAAWLAWFACLFVLWLGLVGTVQQTELLAGLFAAAIAASSAEVVRSLGLFDFRVEWRWLRQLWKPLVRVVPEFLLVLLVLFRPRRGQLRTLDFPVGGQRAVDAGRRAFAVLAGSLAPNRLVIDVDPEAGGALVHDLVPERSSAELP